MTYGGCNGVSYPKRGRSAREKRLLVALLSGNKFSGTAKSQGGPLGRKKERSCSTRGGVETTPNEEKNDSSPSAESKRKKGSR